MYTSQRSAIVTLFGSLLLAIGGSLQSAAQTASVLRLRVDDTQRTTLHGNVNPAVQSGVDLGTVSEAEPAGRLILVLKRSEAQETALQAFLVAAHQPGSPTYHQWLTPKAFGSAYGPADSDIEQVKAWMQGQGLTVGKIAQSKSSIEFTGTVGQVNKAFQTSIHSYNLNGSTFRSNATEPTIPSALTPLVVGPQSLNSIGPRPLNVSAGRFSRSVGQTTAQPLYTYPASPLLYFLGPEDVAVQYDLKPVYNAGYTGKGQIIGIMNNSNIDLSVVANYRKLFGLSANQPQVVIDGNDPGINANAIEAYLDVETAMASAPDATIRLYTAGTYGAVGAGGLVFSFIRAVEDDTAPVLSLSFGTCESALGTAGNALVNELWAQAAAQGQTVLVSSGDTGVAGCDRQSSTAASDGLAVNGLGSTPWNVSVGGTDFLYSDYATGGASISNYWSPTNDALLGSLLKPVPEQPWNETFYGMNIAAYESVAMQHANIIAGGGGASTCSTSTLNTVTNKVTCVSGYAKPVWQTGTGTVADGLRDIPDISLFAGSVSNGTGWFICTNPGDCVPSAVGSYSFEVVGGTSASTPAMAGIMSLINQKYGPQGQADFVLYQLAKQYPAAIKPVDIGNNNVPCVSGTPNCRLGANGLYSYGNFFAQPGYDEASGLGSVDANAMFTNWGSVSLKPTTTSFLASANTITHGQSIQFETTVTSSSGGSPTGYVGLVSTNPLPAQKGLATITLGAGSTGTIDYDDLPGGSYTVQGLYSGDGLFGASKSYPVSVTVNPEPSNINFTAQNYIASTAALIPLIQGGTYPYGTTIYLQANPGSTYVANGAPATGTVTFQDNGSTLQTVAITSAGTSQLVVSGTLGVGNHSLGAAFSGDPSYKPSTSPSPVNFTIAKSSTFIFLDYTGIFSGHYVLGDTPVITVAVEGTTLAHFPPTGTMTFALSNGTTQTMNVVVGNTQALATVSLPGLAVGSYSLVATYNGDSNYTGKSVTISFTVANSGLLPSFTGVSLVSPSNPATITSSTLLTFIATVQGPAGSVKAPTGTVAFYDLSYYGVGSVALVPGSGNSSTATFTIGVTSLPSGNFNSVQALYSGSSTYDTSVSTAANFFTPVGNDFSVNALTPNITIAAGATGTGMVSLTSIANFNGTVQLTCAAPATFTCSVNPSTAITLMGQATAIVTIQSGVAMAALDHSIRDEHSLAALAAIGFIALISVRRRRFTNLLSLLVALVFVVGAVGCSGTPSSTSATSPTKAGTYAVVVTGLSSYGVVHDTTITVIVR